MSTGKGKSGGDKGKGGKSGSEAGSGAVSLPKVNSPSKPAASSTTAKSAGAATKNNSQTTKLPAIGGSQSPSKDATKASNDVADTILNVPDASAQPIPVQGEESENGTPAPVGSTESGAISVPGESQATSTLVPITSATDNPVSEAAPVVVEAPPPPVPPKKRDGMVILHYGDQYHESFPIAGGSITAAEIDDVYCLTFVMPNCRILLSVHTPAAKRQLEADDLWTSEHYVFEDPEGTFRDLEADCEYHVYALENAEQLRKDQEATRKRLAGMAQEQQRADKKDDGRVLESCSCIYGNPCVDEYGCKDWSNRFAVAKKNGWKGF